MNCQWLVEKNNAILMSVYIVPRASKSEIVGIYNDCVKIKLNAQPKDNEANKELIYFLSKSLKTPRSKIEIISGHKQRNKVVSLINCDFKKIIGIIEVGTL